MVAKIRKWGNSLALRIPKALAAEAGIEDNSTVELSLRGGKLIISAPRESRPSLSDLLGRINQNNLHREVKTGPARGKEKW